MKHISKFEITAKWKAFKFNVQQLLGGKGKKKKKNLKYRLTLKIELMKEFPDSNFWDSRNKIFLKSLYMQRPSNLMDTPFIKRLINKLKRMFFLFKRLLAAKLWKSIINFHDQHNKKENHKNPHKVSIYQRPINRTHIIIQLKFLKKPVKKLRKSTRNRSEILQIQVPRITFTAIHQSNQQKQAK